MRKTALILFLAFFGSSATAQVGKPDSTMHKPTIAFSGFVDAYYVYDFNKPGNNLRPGFLYNHNRHNEFNVNVALFKASYSAENVRGNIGFMAGTYPQYNLAAEQDLLKNIFEANAGFKVADRLWLDAGIFGSHIGFESAISKNNWTLTRSILAENSPYYLAGAKLTFEASKQWTLTGLIVNGWQNIRETPGNSNKAIGTQLQFKPSSRVLLNSSTFIGNEQPDHARQMRYFHNFYTVIELTEKLGLTVGVDYGVEKKLRTRGYNRWYSPVVIARYRLLPSFVLSGRVEHYNDRDGVIISTSTIQGFQTSGYSIGLDFVPVKSVSLRIEGRSFTSKDYLFTKGENEWDKRNTFIASSIAISF